MSIEKDMSMFILVNRHRVKGKYHPRTGQAGQNLFLISSIRRNLLIAHAIAEFTYPPMTGPSCCWRLNI